MIDVCIASLFTHGSVVSEYRIHAIADCFPIRIYTHPSLSYSAGSIFQIPSCCRTSELSCIGYGTICRIGDDAPDDLFEDSSDGSIGSGCAREEGSIWKKSRHESIESSSSEENTDEDDEFAHIF